MYTYAVFFKGRKLGALGRFYEIATDVQADSPENAVETLYKKYDLQMRPRDEDVILLKQGVTS